jgi:hypothetical protein
MKAEECTLIVLLMVINVFKNSKSKMRIVFVLICNKKDQETLFLSKMD